MKQWKPQDWVAIIAMLTIMASLVGGVVLALLFGDKLLGLDPSILIKRYEHWRDIILVLIGAVSGYIGGKNSG